MEYSPSKAILIQLLEAIMAKYINRGDPPTYDFNLPDLTCDGSWCDLDLSAIVPPAGANQLVHIKGGVEATKSNNIINYRTKGNVNEINTVKQVTPAANVPGFEDFFVLMDANRKIQYNASIDDWTLIQLTVRGWIEE